MLFPAGYLGGHHGAAARGGHVEAPAGKRDRRESTRRRRRNRLQACREPEARRLCARVELQLDFDDLSLRPARRSTIVRSIRWRACWSSRRCWRCAPTPRGRRSASFSPTRKRGPGKITVGNSGIGSHTHISSAALFKAAGVEVIEVPYGAAQVVPNLLGGHVDAVVQLPGALSAHVKARNGAAPRRADPAAGSCVTRCAHGARAGRERLGRGMARNRGAKRHAGGRRRRARSGDPQDSRSAGIRASCEKLGIRPAYMPAADFGSLIAKEDAELATLMQQIGLKKQP